MKNVKIVSYTILLAVIFSCAQPIAAREGLFKRARSSESIAKIETRLKSFLTQLNDYKKCVASGQGCSRTKKVALRAAAAAIAAAITTLFLMAIGVQKKTEEELVEARGRKERQRYSEVQLKLYDAIGREDVAEVAKIIRSNRKLLTIKDDQGRTPLMIAIEGEASSSNRQVIGTLIDVMGKEIQEINDQAKDADYLKGKTAWDYVQGSTRPDKKEVEGLFLGSLERTSANAL